MYIVLLTALGVGGATIAGSILGFIFKNISSNLESMIMAFSAGVMLAASVFGLIIPALDYGRQWELLIVLLGIYSGALIMDLLERLVAKLRPNTHQQNRVLLFVAAIAIHNLPEGVAAGVGFGSGDMSNALIIAGSIALQNIPEGMIIIAPMLSVGFAPKKTLLLALSTGLIEVFGTLFGYFTVTVSSAILPFALAFAGGTMLFIICGEMIPNSCCGHNGTAASYSLLAGFCIILALSVLL